MPKCVRGSVSITINRAQYRLKFPGGGAWGNWKAVPNAPLPMTIGPYRFNTCTCPKGRTPRVSNCVAIPAINIPTGWYTVPQPAQLPFGVQAQFRVSGSITINQKVCDLSCVAQF